MFPSLLGSLREHVPDELDLPAYFTMLIVGFGLATWLGSRWARRTGLDREVIIDLGLFSLIAGVIGGRILHVIADGYFWDYVHLCTDPSKVVWRITQEQCAQSEGVWDAAQHICRPGGRDCFAWAAFWRGGLTYYGGLFAGTGFGLWFLRRERFPIRKAIDMAGMVIPLGLFWGRLGCFLGGCCFGSPHEGWPSVRFPPWSAASESEARSGLITAPYLESLPVHPVQLYEALGSLLIAALLMFAVHPRKRFDGEVFVCFLGLYAFLRFCVEFFRADERGAVLGLSTSQFLGLVILAISVGLWIHLSRTAKRRTKVSRNAQPL